MTDQHPITPPPYDLIMEWAKTKYDRDVPFSYTHFIATQAARWGADQELEACCAWLKAAIASPAWVKELRAARRPKPPSLKEQALEALKDIECEYVIGVTTSTIRRALEALPND